MWILSNIKCHMWFPSKSLKPLQPQPVARKHIITFQGFHHFRTLQRHVYHMSFSNIPTASVWNRRSHSNRYPRGRLRCWNGLWRIELLDATVVRIRASQMTMMMTMVKASDDSTVAPRRAPLDTASISRCEQTVRIIRGLFDLVESTRGRTDTFSS